MNDNGGNEDALAAARKRIDALDTHLLELISERAGVAAEVARIKAERGEADGDYYRPEREAEVLRRVAANNPGPLDEQTVTRLMREIMSACLALESPLSVAYLGPAGTYTQAAVHKHFGAAVETMPLAAIDEVFREVATGNVDYGVVPVENSTEGVVSHTLDQLVSSQLRICGEVALPVHHNLMSHAPALDQVTRVIAHAQSLAQCRTWLDSHMPGVAREAVASNGEAARVVAQEDAGAAAIAGQSAAALYDVPVLAANIEDEPDNTTRFLVLGTRSVPASGDDRTSVMVAIDNQPGMLHRLLTPIAEAGVDLVRIESRPSRRMAWNYNFFIDMVGHVDDAAVAAALEAIRKQAATLKILGSYPKAVR